MSGIILATQQIFVPRLVAGGPFTATDSPSASAIFDISNLGAFIISLPSGNTNIGGWLSPVVGSTYGGQTLTYQFMLTVIAGGGIWTNAGVWRTLVTTLQWGATVGASQSSTIEMAIRQVNGTSTIVTRQYTVDFVV